jgi:hypothetical protein
VVDVPGAEEDDGRGRRSDDGVDELHRQHVPPDGRVDDGHEVEHAPAAAHRPFLNLGRLRQPVAPRLHDAVAQEVVGQRVAAEEVLQLEAVDERADGHADEQPGDEDLEEEGAVLPLALSQHRAGHERTRRTQEHRRRAAAQGERDRGREGHRECGE